MGYPTKVQLIQRKASEQWYINFPSAVAQAMEFTKGELVEWIIEDKANLIVHRTSVPDSPVKVKKTKLGS
ncbi:MAG: hypothetical protein ABUJ93_12160 [Hyphomicrobium sp.]